MEAYGKILEMVNAFCQDVPEKGFEVNYLQRANEIWELFLEANCLAEEGNDEDVAELQEVLKKMEELLK